MNRVGYCCCALNIDQYFPATRQAHPPPIVTLLAVIAGDPRLVTDNAHLFGGITAQHRQREKPRLQKSETMDENYTISDFTDLLAKNDKIEEAKFTY